MPDIHVCYRHIRCLMSMSVMYATVKMSAPSERYIHETRSSEVSPNIVHDFPSVCSQSSAGEPWFVFMVSWSLYVVLTTSFSAYTEKWRRSVRGSDSHRTTANFNCSLGFWRYFYLTLCVGSVCYAFEKLYSILLCIYFFYVRVILRNKMYGGGRIFNASCHLRSTVHFSWQSTCTGA